MTQKPMPIKLFFAYSHKDEHLRNELGNHLVPLERMGFIEGWHDRRIVSGKEFEKEIDERINACHIILLLISSDFVASEYCYSVETKRALERRKAGEAHVVPIILRDCDWTILPFGKLNALPTDGKPVTSWCNQDEAFANIAKGIRTTVEELNLELNKIVSPLTPVSLGWNLPVIKTITWRLNAVFVVGRAEYQVNGKRHEMDAVPYIKEGRIYVPIKHVAEALDVNPSNIIWDSVKKGLTIIKDDKVVQISVDTPIININGVPVTMDVHPEVISDQIMIPVRWASKLLSADVSWDAATETIIFYI